MDKNYVSERITELRMESNISEYQLSLGLGKSKSYIQNITSGKAFPSLSGLIDICDYFELSLADFFTPTEKKALEEKLLVLAFNKLDANSLSNTIKFIEILQCILLEAEEEYMDE